MLFASIVEFYNPRFRLVAKDIPFEGGDDVSSLFFIGSLRDGYDEEYLRLTHGFLKKSIHVGIEREDEYVKAVLPTLELLKRDENTCIFVMANEERFIGYIALNIHPALHINGLECIVREVYVLDEFQRLGIGRALMNYIERYAKKRGCKRVSLATNWTDEKQRGFYESLGFSRRCDFVTKYI